MGAELNEAEIAKHPHGENNSMRLSKRGWERKIALARP
jgi:hypothetical protein